jgi:hypothetical protein
MRIARVMCVLAIVASVWQCGEATAAEAPKAASGVCSRPHPPNFGQVTFSPSRGGVGTLFHYRGKICHSVIASAGRSGIPMNVYSVNVRECQFYPNLTDARRRIVRSTGKISGQFRIGSRGRCGQSNGSLRSTPHGTYQLDVGCMVCQVGTFVVSPGQTPSGQQSLPMTGGPFDQFAEGGGVAILIGAAATLASRRPRRRLSSARSAIRGSRPAPS